MPPLWEIHFLQTQRKGDTLWDFPGGTVGRNRLVDAGDKGSIPGLGRFHLLQSNYSRASSLQLLNPCAAAIKGHVPRPCALQQEKPLQ